MVKQKQDKYLRKSIFIGLVLILLFLFMNNPLSAVKEMANSNLLLIGSLGFLVFGLGAGTFYPITSKQDLLGDMSLGLIFGAIGIIVINVILQGATGIFNMVGTIAPATIASFAGSPEQIFFVCVVYPLTETII